MGERGGRTQGREVERDTEDEKKAWRDREMKESSRRVR